MDNHYTIKVSKFEVNRVLKIKHKKAHVSKL